jgi:hypothetical protein
MTTRPHLHKKTVNLTDSGEAALELAARLSGDNQTDTINRALRTYAKVLELEHRGDDVLAREKVPGGSVTERLLVFL